MTDLLPDQLRIMADAYPDEVGYENVTSGAALTFAEWEAQSNSLARWLIEAGVETGDRVSIHLPPEQALDWLVTYFAVHKAGAVAVPTSTRLVTRELGFVLGHAGAAVAVTGDATVLPDLAELRVALVPGTREWAAAVGADDSEIQVPLTGDDMADIMYTSGTTGRPKGVVVRHRNVAMVPNGKPRWSGNGWLHASPFFTFAGIACASNPMKLGMKGMYMPRFDAGQWLGVVERERPIAVFLVPAMAELLIAHPRFAVADLSSVAICPLGSAPLAPATQARLQERFVSATVSNSWGMTEAGPAFCSMPPEEAARRVGSVGKPVPPTEFMIVDGHGAALPAGEVGELLVRNPGREREYFNDPEATASTWRDGWLHTGDLAYLDADGFLYIVGRQKDVIIRGGNNIHAGDVEVVLYEHPAVQEAAVAGVPHDVLGEDVGAWIVLRPGTTVDEEELKAYCAERLADYKVPRRITVLDALPRNPTGKVVKKELPR